MLQSVRTSVLSRAKPMNALGKFFGVAIVLAGIGGASPSLAADAVVPTLTVSREDVVQATVKRFEVKGTTNEWVITWQYTERGAGKVRAFREAHVGHTPRMRIGDYETKPRLVKTNWLRQQGIAVSPTNETTQVLRVNAEEARKILAELEKK